jgi:hypothetical protein
LKPQRSWQVRVHACQNALSLTAVPPRQPSSEPPPLSSSRTRPRDPAEIRARPPAPHSSSTVPVQPGADAAAHGLPGATSDGRAATSNHTKDEEKVGHLSQQERTALSLALSDLYKLHGRGLRSLQTGASAAGGGRGGGCVTVDGTELVNHVRYIEVYRGI